MEPTPNRIQLFSVKNLEGIAAVGFCYDCKKPLAGRWAKTGAVEDRSGMHLICDNCYDDNAR